MLWVSGDVLLCTSSIWHMCTMSVDRYLTLKYPVRYGRNKTNTTVVLKIFFVWVLSVAISSPLCILGLIDKSLVYNNGTCLPTLKTFIIYGSVLAFYVPLIIMILTYAMTFRILWKNKEMMRHAKECNTRLRVNQSTVRPSLSIPQMNVQVVCETNAVGDTDTLDNRCNVSASTTAGGSCNWHDERFTMSPSGSDDHYHTEPNNGQQACLETEPIASNCSPLPLHSAQPTVNGNEARDQEKASKKTVNAATRTSKATDGRKPEEVHCESVENTVHEHTLRQEATRREDDKCDEDKSPDMSGNQERLYSPVQSPTSLQTGSFIQHNEQLRNQHHGTTNGNTTETCISAEQANTREHVISVDSNACKLLLYSQVLSSTESIPDTEKTHTNDLYPDRNTAEQRCSLACTQQVMKECHQSPAAANQETDYPTAIRKIATDNQNKEYLTAKQNNLDMNSKTQTPFNITDTNPVSRTITPCKTAFEQRGVNPSWRNKKIIEKKQPHASKTNSDLDVSDLTNPGLKMTHLHPLSATQLTNADDCAASFLRSAPNNGSRDTTTDIFSVVVSSDADDTAEDSDAIHTNDDSPCTERTPARKRDIAKRKYPQRARYRNTPPATTRSTGKWGLSNKTASNERKASNVLGIIFLVFAVLWTPFFTVNILSVTCRPCMRNVTHDMMSVFLWMGYVASLTNPIVYTMFNTAFRDTFIHLLTCQMTPSSCMACPLCPRRSNKTT